MVLTHAYARAVSLLLQEASRSGRRFSVLVTEARPDGSGYRMARELRAAGVGSVTMLADAAVAHYIDTVSVVLLGAEAVVGSGGLVGRIGTYQTALLARSAHRPVYAAAESFKFMREYPLGQRDVSRLFPGAPASSNYATLPPPPPPPTSSSSLSSSSSLGEPGTVRAPARRDTARVAAAADTEHRSAPPAPPAAVQATRAPSSSSICRPASTTRRPRTSRSC